MSKNLLSPRTRKYLALSHRYDKADKQATRFESGYYYNPLKGDLFREKANNLISQMNALELTEEEFTEIDDYYKCY